MKGARWVFAGLIVLALMTCSAYAAPKDRPAGGKDRAPGAKHKAAGVAKSDDVTGMAEELKLTEQQIKAIEAELKKRDEAIGKLEEAMSRQLDQLDKALEKARTKTDRNKLSELIEQTRTGGQRKRLEIEATYAKKIMALLTEQQRAQWNAAKLQEAMLNEFGFLALAGEQEDKIKALSAETGGKITTAADVRYLPATKSSTAKQIYQKILTKEQQKQYAEKKLEETRPKAKEDDERHRKEKDRERNKTRK